MLSISWRGSFGKLSVRLFAKFLRKFCRDSYVFCALRNSVGLPPFNSRKSPGELQSGKKRNFFLLRRCESNYLEHLNTIWGSVRLKGINIRPSGQFLVRFAYELSFCY